RYKRLVQFVKGGAKIPTTGGALSGLPFVLPRIGKEANEPSLLFLNLPESSEPQDPPSTADRVLEKLRGRVVPMLPLFGVAGCGKTRTAIEMLSKNWGFYFNGSGTDWGSHDLYDFLQVVSGDKNYLGCNIESNTRVHILALALILCRVMILCHCLDIAEREGKTFSCKQWMLLQFANQSVNVEDLFATLFTSIAKVIHSHTMDITIMRAFVQERFSRLHQRLEDLAPETPVQSSSPKVLLVIDEAQILGSNDWGTFLSQRALSGIERQAGAASCDQDHLRPILSPLIHGFYQITAQQSQACVVPCGTGLSLYDMEWLLDSAPGPKGYAELLKPFREFEGWSSLEHVQSYRALVRSSLSSDNSKAIFDKCVPETSTTLLFERLRGRFRPIVSAIELMITSGNASSDGEIDWEKQIMTTELQLISTENGYFTGGNIAFDISRMISRIDLFKSRYAKYQNIRTILQFFVLQYYLHGCPVVLHTEEAPLVEASVGRIMNVGGAKRTVLDEPFALRAAVNYFRKEDPDFHSAICSLFSLSPTASVLGSTWEMAVLPSLVHIFNDKVLSDTTLVPPEAVRCDNGLLDSKAKIVGLDQHMLGTDHRSMSLNEFLEAHVENGSRKDGKQVPAFYHPAETPSGPDIVFVLNFDNHGLCPVFIQLKLRASMSRPETLGAFTTVKADAVQGHLGENKLQTFCTVSPKWFLGVVIDYPAELPGVEGLFPQLRRSVRIPAAQKEQSPQCILLRIDKNNIHDLFPEAHMKALDLLKGIKRELELDNDGLAEEYAKRRRL
ncbi:hypothetical protein BGZ65_008693, partial [Modicella reniformis]